jgi:nitrogen fixation protein NifU and related proteins
MGKLGGSADREVVVLSRQEYIENILDHHDQPRNRRRIEGADIEASGGNPGCGDIVRIYAKLDPEGRIVDAAFEGEGCTISQAGASMLTEDLLGKTPDEVTNLSFENVMEEMGRDVVASRTRCATLALSTAKAAAADYVNSKRFEAAAQL